jgi:hypothetical protein
MNSMMVVSHCLITFLTIAIVHDTRFDTRNLSKIVSGWSKEHAILAQISVDINHGVRAAEV